MIICRRLLLSIFVTMVGLIGCQQGGLTPTPSPTTLSPTQMATTTLAPTATQLPLPPSDTPTVLPSPTPSPTQTPLPTATLTPTRATMQIPSIVATISPFDKSHLSSDEMPIYQMSYYNYGNADVVWTGWEPNMSGVDPDSDVVYMRASRRLTFMHGLLPKNWIDINIVTLRAGDITQGKDDTLYILSSSRKINDHAFFTIVKDEEVIAEVETPLSSIRALYYDDLSGLLYAIGQGEDETTGYVLAYRGTELLMEWAFPDRAMQFIKGDRFGAIYIVPQETIELPADALPSLMPYRYTVVSVRGTDPQINRLIDTTNIHPFLYASTNNGDYVYYVERDYDIQRKQGGGWDENARSDDGTWHQINLFRDGQVVSQDQRIPDEMNGARGIWHPEQRQIYGEDAITSDGEIHEGVFSLFSIDEAHQIVSEGTIDLRVEGVEKPPKYVRYVSDESIDTLYGFEWHKAFYVIRGGRLIGRIAPPCVDPIDIHVNPVTSLIYVSCLFEVMVYAYPSLITPDIQAQLDYLRLTDPEFFSTAGE